MGPEESCAAPAGARHRLRVAVVIGGAWNGPLAAAVDRWFAANARRLEAFDLDLIEVPLPADVAAPPIYRADAFVVIASDRPADVTDPAWHAKPVAHVPFSGVDWGRQAAERLRQAFARLHAMTLARADPGWTHDPTRTTAKTMLDWLEGRSNALFATPEYAA